jgi:hypothetical protein
LCHSRSCLRNGHRCRFQGQRLLNIAASSAPGGAIASVSSGDTAKDRAVGQTSDFNCADIATLGAGGERRSVSGIPRGNRYNSAIGAAADDLQILNGSSRAGPSSAATNTGGKSRHFAKTRAGVTDHVSE